MQNYAVILCFTYIGLAVFCTQTITCLNQPPKTNSVLPSTELKNQNENAIPDRNSDITKSVNTIQTPSVTARHNNEYIPLHKSNSEQNGSSANATLLPAANTLNSSQSEFELPTNLNHSIPLNVTSTTSLLSPSGITGALNSENIGNITANEYTLTTPITSTDGQLNTTGPLQTSTTNLGNAKSRNESLAAHNESLNTSKDTSKNIKSLTTALNSNNIKNITQNKPTSTPSMNFSQQLNTTRPDQPPTTANSIGNTESTEASSTMLDTLPDISTNISENNESTSSAENSNYTSATQIPMFSSNHSNTEDVTNSFIPTTTTSTILPTSTANLTSKSENKLTPSITSRGTTNKTTPNFTTTPASVYFTSTKGINEQVTANTTKGSQNQSEILIYSAVYFTNGAVETEENYTEVTTNSTSWQFESYHLTNIGQSQMYQLGKYLATRYTNLLNGSPNNITVKIDSSKISSVLMSAEYLLNGLLPSKKNETQYKSIQEQSTQIHEISPELDEISTMSKNCCQYQTEINTVNQLQDWKNSYETYNSVFDTLNSFMHQSSDKNNIFLDFQSAFTCYVDFNSMIENAKSLPWWAEQIYPHQLSTLAVDYLKIETYTDTMKKIKAGPFLKAVVEEMEELINDKSTIKLHLYSGIAQGMAAIMNSLGIFNSIVPPHASALLIELYEKNGEHIVAISYKNSTGGFPYPLNIPHCQPNCTLNQFVSITQNLILIDWDAQCNCIINSILTYSTPLLITGLIVLIAIVFIFVLVSIKFCRCINKKKATITRR